MTRIKLLSSKLKRAEINSVVLSRHISNLAARYFRFILTLLQCPIMYGRSIRHKSFRQANTQNLVINRHARLLASIQVFLTLVCLETTSFARSALAETASYYTYQSCVREGTSGVWTASGERFNENDLTCALRSRDFGGLYKVTNLNNGKSVVVRHNDFGPNKKLHAKGRIIDLSLGAFLRLADTREGIISVSVERINSRRS